MANQEWDLYKITLTTMEPLHIGGTKHVLSDIDNPIVLLKGDTPAIPATTLKGAWRSQIERYLISYLESNKLLDDGEKLGIKPCIPTSNPTLDERFYASAKKYKRELKEDRKTHQKEYVNELDPCTYDNYSDYICPACYLLGAQTLQGFVRVPFLMPKPGQSELNVLLYSIREDRAKGGAAKGTNREWYVVNPEVEFEGILEVLRVDKLREWTFGQKRAKLKLQYKRLDRWLDHFIWDRERLIKELITDRIQAISILGGYKSRGCGKVKITVSPLQNKGIS